MEGMRQMSSDLLVSFSGNYTTQVDLLDACKREALLAKRGKRNPRFKKEDVRESGNLTLRPGTCYMRKAELEILKVVLGESVYRQFVFVHEKAKPKEDTPKEDTPKKEISTKPKLVKKSKGASGQSPTE
jgi:hypothetical protein